MPADDDAAREAERLVELCGDDVDRPAWLVALREGRADLEAAGDGRRWRFDVDMVGLCRTGVGILSDGMAVRVAPDGPVDAKVAGSPTEVAAFVLGHGTMAEAVADGLFVPSAGAPLDVLAQIRNAVSAQLRRIVAGPAVVFAMSRRVGWRLQRLCLSFSSQLPCVVEGMAPVVVAVAVLIGVGGLTTHGSPPVQLVSLASAHSAASSQDTRDRPEVVSNDGDRHPQNAYSFSGAAEPEASLVQPTPGVVGVASRAEVRAPVEGSESDEDLRIANHFGVEAEADCQTTMGGALCLSIRAVSEIKNQ